MKKIYLVMLSLIVFASGFAQKHKEENSKSGDWSAQQKESQIYRGDKSVAGNDYRNERGNSDYRRKESEIQKINADFERRIESVRRNRYLKANEKSRQIRILKKEQAEKVAMINRQYSRNDVSYNQKKSTNGRY